MDRPMVEHDRELVYMRFISLHESDSILWDQELAMFLVVMVSAVQCISLDKVKVYGVAVFMLCLFMCSLSVGIVSCCEN